VSSAYEDDRAHLAPRLEAIQASGNHAVSHWFIPRPGGGWDVHLRQNLDGALIGQHLDADPLADHLRVAGDTIYCAHCSTWIHGANS